MPAKIDLTPQGITVRDIRRNLVPAVLYEEAARQEDGALIANGAVVVSSREKTGRSPDAKRIVEHPDSAADLWWGEINIKLAEESFHAERRRAIDHLNSRPFLYVVDAFAGWNSDYRRKVRVICTRPYHALFMHHMLVRPSPEELEDFGDPDYVIYNAGIFKADDAVEGVGSDTCVALSFEHRELVILGTQYAGEMKKGVFTVMNYIMPKEGVFSMHCSANEGERGDVSLFFGLSGTGKTTLSADPARRLIGDDEHCWSDNGIFNIEGGCYAKCIKLREEKEPQIWNAIRFGTVLENVVFDPVTREPDYDDDSVTENTRGSYPIEYIPNAKIPCEGPPPSNIIFLTCDAFGIMPPVSRLNSAQARYHFMSGYTAKVAGTEQGITEPKAAFSALFGAPFMVWHPQVYADLLAAKVEASGARIWLVNTGWTGGAYGEGKRIDLAHTRAMLDAIHAGSLDDAEFREEPVFGLAVPTHCPDVPEMVLNPRDTWDDPDAYDRKASKLAELFRKNFEQFSGQVSDEVQHGGPKLAHAEAT
jgi:phosphoenolpyruvate carboxykinase (ATP)